jgi:hypothetical protein
MSKIVFLNAVITSNKMPLTLKTRPVTLEKVREIVKNREIESYIGHEATAFLLSQLLSREISVNRAMYEPQISDVAIVVRLKRRLEKPEDVKNVKPEDLEFILVEYYPY